MSAHAPREAAQERHSAETRISLSLNLDGEGKTRIQTGFGLLDHMLTLSMFWAGMDLQLSCQGDLDVDAHHSVEDVGLTLGRALLEALGLPTHVERLDASALLAPMRLDKKNLGQTLRIILLKSIGQCYVENTSVDWFASLENYL